jgi:PAS domain S-box-containing protein
MLNTVTENRLSENRRLMHLTSRSNPPESQEMLLSRAVETLQDSFIVTDTVGTIQYVNQSAERLFRLEPFAPTNYSIAALFTEATSLNVIIRRAMLNAWQGEVTAQKHSGDTFTAAVTASGVRNEAGHLIGISFVIRDITSQKQRELELERSNKLKSDFLAHMSHELRTPLTLINDILDLSKIEAGQMELEIGPTDLQEVCQSAIELVSETARVRNITIDQSTLPTCQLPADELRIRQVLLNLLTNAIKFSQDGGRIGIEANQVGKLLAITVWDEGIGIPASQQHRLFQPFQQIQSSQSQAARANGKRSNIGTGLGLALSRRLVELHQGYITVESIEGEGSKFTVHLPIGG